jgi:acyl-CoA dehydrogenase
VLDGGEARAALTREIHVPAHDQLGLGTLERALALTVASEPARKKLRDSIKAKSLPRGAEAELFDLAVEKGVLSDAERRQLREAAAAREAAVQVDAFGPEPDAPLPERAPRRVAGAR